MTTASVLGLIGWGFLIMSWVIPYAMKKMSKSGDIHGDRFTFGIVFSAIALVFFAIQLIITYVK